MIRAKKYMSWGSGGPGIKNDAIYLFNLKRKNDVIMWICLKLLHDYTYLHALD